MSTISSHVELAALRRGREGICFVLLLVVSPALLWLLARHVTLAAAVLPRLCSGAAFSASSWVAALVAYPVLEEFLFRRVLCEHFERLLRETAAARRSLLLAPAGANLLSSLLFGLAHVAAHGLLHGLAVMLPSLVLGAVYLRYRSLLLNAALHTYWNGLVLLFCR